MIRPEEVKAKEKYIIWIKFSDGAEGNIDLSHLAGKGVFKYWDKANNFKKVKISRKFRTIVWNDEIDISADNLYLKLTGKKPDDIFRVFRKEKVDA